jgi:GDPmannose 4,6-dehydratase
VQIDPRYYRPTEVDYLLADPARAQAQMGWQPRVRFADLARIMVDADMALLGLEPPGAGQEVIEEKFGEWHDWADQLAAM